MTNEEKILYTICAYLRPNFGPMKFKDVINSNKIKDPFAYLKDNFNPELALAFKFLEKLKANAIGLKCVWEEEYPKRLKLLPNAPIIIFYKGNIEIASQEIISIVGTRKCTPMGIKYAKEFTEELSKYSVICSGLAFGIDSIAGLISTKRESKSIAVLPGSLINPTPRSNKYIFNKIVDSGGLVLSEYPFTEDFTKGAYIARNRIIAGVAQTILLIESPLDGGSLTTCRIGHSNNTDVYTIPANIDLVTFQGNNFLLKTLVAKAVTTPFDIINWGSKELMLSNIEISLNSEEKEVVDIIRTYDDYDSICLALKGKISFDRIYDIILNLEMGGIITRNYSGRYSIN